MNRYPIEVFLLDIAGCERVLGEKTLKTPKTTRFFHFLSSYIDRIGLNKGLEIK
jgi:hypothetical protein